MIHITGLIIICLYILYMTERVNVICMLYVYIYLGIYVYIYLGIYVCDYTG